MRFKRIRKYFRKKNQNPTNNRKKVGIILFATSIGLFFLFAARLGYLVVVGNVAGTSLEKKTAALYEGSKIVKAKRGTIYDRNGVAIAEDATSYSLKAILSKNYKTGDKKLYVQSKDYEKVAAILHDILGLEEKEVIARLKEGAKNELYQVEFSGKGKNITLEKKKKIEQAMEKAELYGLDFDEHPNRIYPNGTFASHFIGYAESEVDKQGIDKGLVGKMGLEAAYNDILSGTDGKIVYQKDNYQNPLPGTVAQKKAAKDGQDIYTTLDSGLQTYLESLMDTAVKKYKPEDATAVLMEAKTGEILAMSQRPTFNPETKKEFSDKDFNWMNLLVEDRYEPGSTMKVMTTAAAIESGVFNENETFTSGEIKVADATINDWDYQEQRRTLTMRQALSWSSNVGMVKLEQKMGDTWQNYLKKFGFGQSTYSGLPGENSGILPTNNIVDKAMSSFGQGIGVTNFQMMRAFSAIANNGKMLEPHYISKIVNNQNDTERVTEPEIVGNPVSAETTAKVREYMRDVIESKDYGSAYGVYNVPGYKIAAKTGTAQIADEKNGGYYQGDTAYLYSIVEMIPAEDPEYVLYMTMKMPEHWEQKALGDIGNALLKRAMEFKDDQPASASENTEKVEIADYRNLGKDSAAADASKNGLVPVVIGTGSKIKEQGTPHGTKVLAGEKLILLTTGSEYYMPDVTNWSKANLVKLGDILGVKVSFKGDGYCSGQSLAPYDRVDGKEIEFTMSQ